MILASITDLNTETIELSLDGQPRAAVPTLYLCDPRPRPIPGASIDQPACISVILQEKSCALNPASQD